MKTMMLAATAALALSVGSAYAQSNNGSGYAFPDFWGDAVTQQPAAAPATGNQANGGIGTYVTQSSHGTWLFPPNPNSGANS